VALDSTAVAELASTVRGQVLAPGHAPYDTAREIWNRRFDRRPALLMRCAGHADVANAVRFAQRHELELAVRGGGHHVAGYASSDGGLLLDLSPIRGIRVDPARRTAVAQTGCTWADFDRETQEFGLACTGPIVSMVGLPGFVLGGGFGWLQRKIGLACDNLVGADIVRADGHCARASLEDDPELLWGLRGAGWNFGVVTSMELRLHEVGPNVLSGLIYFPIDRFAELVQFHRAVLHAAPEELTTWLVLRLAPDHPRIPQSFHGRPVCALAFCHCGSKEDAERWASRIWDFQPGLANLLVWRPYVDWQKALDERWGNGFCNEWRSLYFDDLDSNCVEVLLRFLARLDSPWTDIKIPHLGGAIAREPEGGAAFGNREARYCLVIQARWADPGESEKHLAWAKDLQTALQPFSTGGTYMNFLAPDENDRIESGYGKQAYERLRALKTRMDPQNIFHLNPNIPPNV
jgi:FAD/FMN-containing dehydrogenase